MPFTEAKKSIKDPAHRNGMGYRFSHFSNVNAAIPRSIWEKNPFPEDLKVFEDLGIAKLILDDGWGSSTNPKTGMFHFHTHPLALKRHLSAFRVLAEPENRERPFCRLVFDRKV